MKGYNQVRYDCPQCHSAMCLTKGPGDEIVLGCVICGHMAPLDSIKPECSKVVELEE